jgi:hypothetical protein
LLIPFILQPVDNRTFEDVLKSLQDQSVINVSGEGRKRIIRIITASADA